MRGLENYPLPLLPGLHLQTRNLPVCTYLPSPLHTTGLESLGAAGGGPPKESRIRPFYLAKVGSAPFPYLSARLVFARAQKQRAAFAHLHGDRHEVRGVVGVARALSDETPPARFVFLSVLAAGARGRLVNGHDDKPVQPVHAVQTCTAAKPATNAWLGLAHRIDQQQR